FLYPALYPPTLAWFVAPFAALPFAAGYALWNVVLVASLLVTWWLTAPPSSRLVRLGHLAFAIALPSVAFGLLLGQVVIVVAAAVSICWWLSRHNRPFAAGLVLFVIAIILGLVWRRRGSGLEFPFAAGLCASLLIASFLHPQDVAVLLPAAWLWLRTAPRGAERVLGLTGFVAALGLTTPLPLLLVLAGWLVSDRTVGLRVSRRSRSSSSNA